MPDTAPWVIVETKPHCEERVERGLRQHGYRVYLPRYRRLLTPHGSGRRDATAMRPLFSRIVFCQDWRGWPRASVTGVFGLMRMTGGNTAKLPDSDIFVIMTRERAGEFDDVQFVVGTSRMVVRDDIASGDSVEF